MGEMKQICEQEGIKLHTSVRYSPESNGVAERTTGYMLHVRGSLESYGQRRTTQTYLHSRTPTALGGRTPYGMLYCVKPDVSHMRAFRMPCAIVEPKERLKKLDYRATMSFFVGYKYEGGGYGS